MRRLLPQTTAAALLLGATLIVSSTGGAVAGSLITGKQIKDGSLSGKDVKDSSLKTADLSADTVAALKGQNGAAGPAGAPGLSQLVLAQAFVTVPNGGTGNLQLTCPDGKRLLSATSFWSVSPRTAVKVDYSPTLQTAFAVYSNTSGDEENLTIEGVCATVA